MSALEIEFHCLCLFVPDPENGLVHVLMPSTAGGDGDGGHHNGHPGHDGAGGEPGQHRHVHDRHHAFIRHDSLTEPVLMEGWALLLGREGGPIDTTLAPTSPVDGARLVDLNEHTGRTLDPTLLLEQADPRVIARVTLREGALVSTYADAVWRLKGKKVRMASRSTWRIDDFPGGALDWNPLTASGEPPLATLDDVVPTGGVRRVHVFHTTRHGMAGARTVLTPYEAREHFRVYLELYGIRPQHDPNDLLLPEIAAALFVGVDCPNGTGRTK
jgi:hypothetical protein